MAGETCTVGCCALTPSKNGSVSPLGKVFCEEYPYSETQGQCFHDPEDPVKDLFVAGCGFVVGRKFHMAPFSPGPSHRICDSIANL